MYYLVLGVLCAVAQLSKIQAGLQIITYEPLVLKLTFTQPLVCPQFQLLFNQIPIAYSVDPPANTSQSKQFRITGSHQGIVDIADYLTEKYVIMFTQPLDIADGTLNLDSFLLRANRSLSAEYTMSPIKDKSSYYKFQNFQQTLNPLAIAICVLIYFLTYTTLIGINAYSFLAIYVYISLKTSLFTALDYRIAYYLLFDAHQLEKNSGAELTYLMIPYMCMAFSLAVSLLSRVFLKKLANSSGLCNYVYYYLTYKFFIITWEIMCVPLFANSAHILYESSEGIHSQHYIINYIYVYINFVVIGFYLYMAYFAANPQVGEGLQKWKQYTTTSHFQLFEGFHLGIDPESRVKRNYQFIYSCIRILIMIAVTAIPTQIPNIFLQVLYLIYIFTTRPFRYNFFNNFYIGIQALIIVFYLYRYIVELYVGISQEIATSTDMARILLTNIIFVCLIVLTYLVLGAYEFYQRVRVFKINMSAWKRQSKYGDHEIRRTKRSAFERQMQQDRQKKEEKKSSRKKDKQGQSGTGKQGKKAKEKSSLLQSISLEVQSPQ